MSNWIRVQLRDDYLAELMLSHGEPFEGDIDDYQASLLGERGGKPAKREEAAARRRRVASQRVRDARDLEPAGAGWLWLDRRRTTRFCLDENMLVIDAERNGVPAIWVSCENMEDLPADKPQVFWASPGTPLKTVMAAMHRSATAPVALFDEQSRFVGSIGVRDVLKAVIRR